MRTRLTSLHTLGLTLATIASASAAAAQAAPAPAPAVAASTLASVEVRFNGRYIGGQWLLASPPARIRIEYGQPHMRGRKIVGSVVPLDSVWRLGANVSTELEASVDFTLGGTRIPHGQYSLFMLPTAKGWTLIVNRANYAWGTDYDPTQDLARIPLRARTIAGDPVESLSIYLEPFVPPAPPAGTTSAASAATAPLPHGVLRIEWEHTELTTDWAMVK